MKDTLDTTPYWRQGNRQQTYPALTENAQADTLIIGGGITGVTCAYTLAQQGGDVSLIEAGTLGGGTTGGSTGKATIQHGVIYSTLTKSLGEKTASLYLRTQQQAMDFIRAFAGKHGEACGFAESESFVYAASDPEKELIQREYAAAQKLGIDAEFVSRPGFPPENRCMLGFKHQAVLHPVRYVQTLAREAAGAGAKIYEHTKAIHIETDGPLQVECENGSVISARHLIVATQFPIYEGKGAFFARLYPDRSYGIAVKATKDWPDGNFINAGSPARSLRTHVENGERILIVVGDGHVTARTGCMEEHINELMRFATVSCGFDDLLAKWSAQDYDTPDNLPFIGRISKHSDIYVACGFGKWGISNGTLAGIMLPELILNGKSEYEELFSPSRLNLKASAGKLLSEVGTQVKELIHSKLEETDSIMDLKPGQARIIPYHGQRAGAFMDDNGRLTIVDITCDHMGCELNWNDAERSWDCPCHGGRYTYDGRLLEGPPAHSLKILYQDKT